MVLRISQKRMLGIALIAFLVGAVLIFLTLMPQFLAMTVVAWAFIIAYPAIMILFQLHF